MEGKLGKETKSQKSGERAKETSNDNWKGGEKRLAGKRKKKNAEKKEKEVVVVI